MSTFDDFPDPELAAAWTPSDLEPTVDLTTGEILNMPTTYVTVAHVVPVETPDDIGAALAAAAELARTPDEQRALATQLGSALLDRVHVMADAARERRPEGRVTAALLQPELALMADVHDTLDGVAKAVAAAAKEARAIAGELVVETAPEREHGTASVRVGEASGGELKVTRTQPTKVAADTDKLLDLLPTWCLSTDAPTPAAFGHEYARGARAVLAVLRELVGPLAWKSTALDSEGRKMDAAGEHDLAIRWGHAYGRVAHGNPSVKIEHVPAKDAP